LEWEEKMRGLILLAVSVVIASVAHADTYQWTDSHGVLHFTDSLDKVPANYLKKVRKVDVNPVIQENRQPSQQRQNSLTPTVKNIFGGHDQEWWRSSFMRLRIEIKNIQDGLPEKKTGLTDLRRKYVIYNKPSTRIAYNELYEDIEKDEARVVELQKQLADLDDAAAKAGVPMEWRR
jgi:hypothetical protein